MYSRKNHWYQHPDPLRRPYNRSAVPTPPIHEPNVIQIPIQFMNSKSANRSGSALKIQKVLRGFLVRENMRRIKEVKMQVDAIEESIARSEVVVEDSIRCNDKERLRIGENLMSLLLKLDSIRCLDLGVRACRKAIIRKAIALQDKIDAIVVAVDLVVKEAAAVESVDDNRQLEIAELSIGFDGSIQPVGHHCKRDFDESREILLCGVNSVEGDEGNNVKENEAIVDVGVDCEVMVVDEGNDWTDMLVDSVVEEKSLIANDGKNYLVEVKVEEGDGNWDDNNKRNRELLERLMEDNEKMMSMMTQLLERNEKQNSIVSALTHRVELLEKAFLCDNKSRKKRHKRMKKDHTYTC